MIVSVCYETLESARKCVVTASRSVTACCGGEKEGMIRHQEMFGDGYIHYLDYRDGFTAENVCGSYQIVYFKYVQFVFSM
jgi:hypothetical protein